MVKKSESYSSTILNDAAVKTKSLNAHRKKSSIGAAFVKQTKARAPRLIGNPTRMFIFSSPQNLISLIYHP